MADSKLTVSLILNNASFTKQLADVNKRLKEAESEFKNAAAGSKNFESSLTGLQTKYDVLNSKMDMQKQKMDIYKNQINATKTTLEQLTSKYDSNKQKLESLNQQYQVACQTFGENSDEARALKQEITNLEKTQQTLENRIVSTNNQLTTLNTGLNNTEAEYKELASQAEETHRQIESFDAGSTRQHWEDLGNTLQQTGAKMKQVGDSLQNAGKTMTATVTAPLVGLGTAAVKTAADFDKSMSNVSALSGITGDSLAELRDKAIEMGANTSKSAKDAADAMGYMALAGWDNKQMLEGIEPILRLSEAANMDLATASDLVTDSMGGLKLTTADLPQYLDQVVKAQNSSNQSAEQLMSAFINCGASATQLGIPVNEAAAALGIFASNGLKGEAAGTTLNSMLIRMTAQSNVAKKAWEEAGVEIFDSQGKFRGLTTVLNETRVALADMTEEQQQYFLKQTVGADNVNMFLQLLNSTGGAYEELAATIADSSGTMMNTVQTQQDNFYGRVVALQSKISTLAIQIGELLMPYAEKLVECIGNLVTKFSNLDEGTQQFIVKAAMVAAAIGPVLLILGQVISIAGSVTSAIGFVTSAFAGTGAAAGAAGTAITALSGPIGWAIAAIALLAVAVATNFGGIRDTITEVMQAVGDCIQSALNMIKYLWETDFMGIQTFTQAVFDAIASVVNTVLNVIKGIFAAFSAAFRGDWQGCWDAVKNIFSTIWEGIKSFLGIALNGLVNTLISMVSTFLNAGYNLFKGIWDGAKNAWDALKRWFEGVKNDPVNTIKGIGSAMWDAGKSIFTSLWDGMKSVWSSISGWFDDKVNSLKEKLTFWKSAKAEMSDASGVANPYARLADTSQVINPFAIQPTNFSDNLEVPNSASYINDAVVSVGTIAQNRQGTAGNTEIAITQTLAATQQQNQLLMQMISLLQQDRITNVDIGIDGKKIARATAKHMNKALYDVNALSLG